MSRLQGGHGRSCMSVGVQWQNIFPYVILNESQGPSRRNVIAVEHLNNFSDKQC